MSTTRSHVLITIISSLRDVIFDNAFSGGATATSPEVGKIINMVKNVKKPGEKLIGLAMDDLNLKQTFWSQTSQLNYNPQKTNRRNVHCN